MILADSNILLRSIQPDHPVFPVLNLLPYTPEVIPIWQQLVVKQNVIGKQTHDAHLAAYMQAHGINEILTFNADDFRRFPHLHAIHPANVS